MRKTLILLIASFSLNLSFGQTDASGNPVFNSVSTAEVTLGRDLLLIANYYTLLNNIENPGSAVFIAESPSLDQVEEASLTLLSEFYILTKKSKVIALINLTNGPDGGLAVTEMASNKQWTVPIILDGDLTENRAKELLKAGFDPHATLEGDALIFNGKPFRIIPNDTQKHLVVSLINEKKLDKLKASDRVIPSKSEPAAYILSETKVGGKLDFFTEIKGKENDGIQIKPGLFTTRMGVALYKWGRACFDIGVNSVEDAWEIFVAYKERELNEREKDYVKKGFYKELEK